MSSTAATSVTAEAEQLPRKGPRKGAATTAVATSDRLSNRDRQSLAQATQLHREHEDRPAGVQPRQAGSCQRVWQRNFHLREGRARCCGLTPQPGRARGLRA